LAKPISRRIGSGFIEGFQGTAFGIMDGMITILGVVVGISQVTSSSTLVVVSGLVAGVANAFGNSIGFYASELAERGEHIRENAPVAPSTEVYMSTVNSFISSLVAMLVPVLPFVLLPSMQAMAAAVTIAMVVLFSLGSYVGHLSGLSRFSFGLRYVILGLIGSGLSYLIGNLLRSLLM
jgi:VIT1/CCC1 family predicted Fe2+/Mn2+ transporter